MSIRDANNARILQNGSTITEKNRNIIIAKIEHDFTLNPNYYEVFINDNLIKTGVTITDNSSNVFQKIDYVRKIIMKPSDILNVGDTIAWDNQNWICISAEKYADIYFKGYIQLANNNLVYYDENEQLMNIPCIITNLSRLDESSDNYLFRSVTDYQVILPNNVQTKIINVGSRFILNDRAFKCEGLDDISSIGIKVAKLSLTEFAIKDDIASKIAWNTWYPIHNYTIEILNGEEQTVKYSETLVLNILVKDNGIDVSPTPLLLFDTSNGTVCTVNSEGAVFITNTSGTAIVTARLASDSSISSSIKINASSSATNNYNYTLVGDIQPDYLIPYGQTRTFTACKYDINNNIVSAVFLFQLIESDAQSKCVLTTQSNTQCKLKALSYPYTFTLRAIDNSNGQYIDKVIYQTSLI